jgi:hypothetical protein
MRHWIVVFLVSVVALTAIATVTIAAVSYGGDRQKWCAVSVDGDLFSTGTQGPCNEVEQWERQFEGGNG